MAMTTSFGSSRAEVAASHLADILSGVETGARLGTKEEVRAKVDASLSLGTFNETLRLLQARGLITVRPGPGGGVFAAEQSPMAKLGNALLGLNIDRSTVAEAVRIRNALEFLIVEDACRYATQADLDAMGAALGKMADALTAEDGIAFLHSNWELHSKIAAATRSEILSSLYLSLLDLVEEHTISVRSAGPMSLTEFHQQRLVVHQELVRVIEDGDLDSARGVVERHNMDSDPRPTLRQRR
ncbi:MAG: FCD domain-containing protein [Nocardioides sp.]